MSSLPTKTTSIAINNGYTTYQQNDIYNHTNPKISNVSKTRTRLSSHAICQESKKLFNHTRGKATSKTNCSLKRLLESHTETILKTLCSYKLICLCWKRVFTGVLKNEVTSSDTENFILLVIPADM